MDHVKTLFYIRDDSELEFNRDLFVCAHSPEEAIGLWRDYYEMTSKDEPVSVYELPQPGYIARALDWNDLNGVMRVWKS